MSFDLDPFKQAQEVIFSRKIKKPSHPVLIFNNNLARQTLYQKILWFVLSWEIKF